MTKPRNQSRRIAEKPEKIPALDPFDITPLRNETAETSLLTQLIHLSVHGSPGDAAAARGLVRGLAAEMFTVDYGGDLFEAIATAYGVNEKPAAQDFAVPLATSASERGISGDNDPAYSLFKNLLGKHFIVGMAGVDIAKRESDQVRGWHSRRMQVLKKRDELNELRVCGIPVPVDGEPPADEQPIFGGADLSDPKTLNDTGLGRRLARMVRGKLVHVRERGMWRNFDGRRWAEKADHLAIEHAKKLHDQLWTELVRLPSRDKDVVRFVHESGSKPRIMAAVWAAQSEPGITRSQSEFDSKPWLLNVRNGVLDLRSGELLPHDPKLNLTQIAAVDYDPDARSPLWERFIEDVTVKNDELADFMQQAFGLALTGDVSDEVLIAHSGDGCNGKSTALEAIAAMLGDYAVTAPPALFMARKTDTHPTEVAMLHGKRFVIAIETEHNRALREHLVKSLTGGDTITTRRLYEDFWEMKPTWHIHIAYNRAPLLTGTDDGIRRRLRVVPWAASFKDRPDLTVKERLLGEGERSGILNWCLEGLRRRLADGRLCSPAAVMVATDDYIDDEDLLARFIGDCMVADSGAYAEIRATLQAFRAWMQADGAPRHVVDSYTANLLGRELARRGFRKSRPDSGPYRKQTLYAGLRLVDDGQYAATAGREDWRDPFAN